MKGFRYAVLTVSDRSARGQREDLSGPAIERLLKALGGELLDRRVVPDEIHSIQEAIMEWTDRLRVDLVLTTGGTGVHPRDVTPEATRPLLDREIPGMAEAMRMASLNKTPHAMLSRAVVGIRGSCLVVNLPGSPSAATENLEVILPALAHALEKIQGDSGECALSAPTVPSTAEREVGVASGRRRVEGPS